MAESAPASTPPDAPRSSGRDAGLGRVLTGTRPGLERVLLASVPSLVAGTVGAYAFAPWVGLLGGACVFAAVWLLSRGVAN